MRRRIFVGSRWFGFHGVAKKALTCIDVFGSENICGKTVHVKKSIRRNDFLSERQALNNNARAFPATWCGVPQYRGFSTAQRFLLDNCGNFPIFLYNLAMLLTYIQHKGNK
jgi:hypothetical protein